MDDVKGNFSANNDKPVIVRVKRKAYHSPLEAFWLEINERPVKRPLLDFQNLSITDSAAKVEEVKTKKIFVRHVETVSSSEFCSDALRPYINNKSVGESESKRKIEERRHNFKNENKQNKLLEKSKQKQEALSKNARFEQIWRSRKGKKEVEDADGLHEVCQVYDVIRVDAEESSNESQKQEDAELEDHRIMSSFLPLLREFIPSAAAEVESDIQDYGLKRASKDGYVYDLYTIKDNTDMEEDGLHPFPLVQVNEDDDFYDGPDESDHDSEDSNAEDNPLNDYPDEESESDEEDESGSSTKVDLAEDDDSESSSVDIDYSSKSEILKHRRWCREADPFDGDLYSDDGYDRDSDAFIPSDDDDDNADNGMI